MSDILQGEKSEIIYKSKTSIFSLLIMILGCILFFGLGTTTLINTQKNGTNWFILFPIIMISFGCFFIYKTLNFKTIIITKKDLIFKYFILNHIKYIPWKSISDAKMSFITTKSDGSDSTFRTGKQIVLTADNKIYSFSTLEFSEPDKLIFQLNKRFDSKLKNKMKRELNDSEKKFWKSEKEYQKWMWRFVIPILLLIVVILMLSK